jgi:hypothetical protein
MSTLSARLQIAGLADLEPVAPHSQTIGHTLENAPGGRGWRQGTGSGEVDRVYLETNTLSSGSSKVYDLSGVGGLQDVLGQDIDADELKGLVIQCTAGQVTFDGHATGSLDFFEDNNHGVVLSAGQTMGVDFGAGGLDVTTHSNCRVTETGSTSSTYNLWLIVAQ